MSSEAPRPEHRLVPCRIFTPAGWITGTLHVPRLRTLLAHMAQSEPFFSLTQVSVPRMGAPMPFMALQKRAAIVIVPLEASSPPAEPGTEEKNVAVLLEGGMVLGSMDVPHGRRVSDELLAAVSFVAVRDCTIGIDESPDMLAAEPANRQTTRGGGARMQSADFALVNTARLLGIAEVN